VRTFDSLGAQVHSFFAYDGFTGGVRVAAGDVNGDDVPDIITGAGAGAGQHVKVFDGTSGAQLGGDVGGFFPFQPAWPGGVTVAFGRFENGTPFLVAGTETTAFQFCRFDDSGSQIDFKFLPDITTGMRVATGDVNADGNDDIITAPTAGAGPVRLFDGVSLALLDSFFAFEPGFAGGVRVAVGDVNGDGVAEIFAAPGAGLPPVVRVFSPTGAQIAELPGGKAKAKGGLEVAVGDLNADGFLDLGLSPGGGKPQVRVLDAFFALRRLTVKPFSKKEASELQIFITPRPPID